MDMDMVIGTDMDTTIGIDIVMDTAMSMGKWTWA
jgi:hypothetical protein